jgi:hypothetical protein
MPSSGGYKRDGRAWWLSKWRIECSWRFADAELARLIRIAESA